MRLLFLLGLLLVSPALAANDGPGGVPRPGAGHWVLDRTGSLNSETVQELDRLGAEADGAGLGQLMVVVVPSTHGRPPRDFALELFNLWGIGGPDRDDGVLLFVSLGDRAAEIILGDGVDGAEDQARSDAAMSSSIVPAFKRGNPDGALLAGARDLLALLRQSPLNAGAPGNPLPRAAPSDADSAACAPGADGLAFPHRPRTFWTVDPDGLLTPDQKRSLDEVGWRLEATGKTRLAVVVYRRDQHPGDALGQVAQKMRQGWGLSPNDWTLVVSIQPPQIELSKEGLELEGQPATDFFDLKEEWEEAAGQFTPWLGLETVARHTEAFIVEGKLPRPSRSAFEVFFDFLSSMGGAVLAFLAVGLAGATWGVRQVLRLRPRRCNRCGSARQRLDEAADDAHLSAGQRQEETLGSIDYDVWWCGSCRDPVVLPNRTWFTTVTNCQACKHRTARPSSRTLSAATYGSGGTVEVTERCAHCQHVRTYTRSTPRLTRSSSSSSSSSSGGGRSSGGGSSGRW